MNARCLKLAALIAASALATHLTACALRETRPTSGEPGMAQAPPPMAPSPLQKEESRSASPARADDAPSTADDAEGDLNRAEHDLDASLGPAGHASPAQNRKRDQELQTETKATPLSDPCEIACRAFASMQRAAETLCVIAGNEADRCSGARERVQHAAERVRTSCPACPVTVR